MAIDATVVGVSYLPDGTARLALEPADKMRAPAGQETIVVVNPRPGLEGIIGSTVWGGSSELMLGQTKIADRIGYGRIRLI